MKTVALKRVTIVTESVLEKRLTEELSRLGARGWTLVEVRGKGARGVRSSAVDGANLKLEVLVGADVAERILEHLASHYFSDFAMIAYLDTVEVVRGEKYI